MQNFLELVEFSVSMACYCKPLLKRMQGQSVLFISTNWKQIYWFVG